VSLSLTAELCMSFSSPEKDTRILGPLAFILIHIKQMRWICGVLHVISVFIFYIFLLIIYLFILKSSERPFQSTSEWM
jgi:hypothetical protein